MDILALDLATVSGWARGCVGDAAPACSSLRFGKPGASQNAILYHCKTWIVSQLDPEPRPDVLAIEALLPTSFVRGRTNKSTNELLAGMHGIVRAEAYERGIYRIEAHPVNAIRAHFIDMNVCARGEAKMYVVRKCKSLGWLETADEDAADAAALWSLVCSQIDPKLALQVSPLFQRGIAI